MGWTFMRNTGGKSPKDYLDAEMGWDNDQVRARLLKSARVGSVYYAAVESIEKATGRRCVWAAVYLTKSCPRARDGYTFRYKDMTEDMGPVESRCPVGILDLLTEASSEYARDWRVRCRVNAALKAKPAPVPGSVIRFKDPITFTDKTTQCEFTLVAYARNGRKRIVFRGANGGLYRIPGYKWLEYTINPGDH